MGRRLRHRTVPVVLVLAWALADAALFRHAQHAYAARHATAAVQLARGAGACLDFNGALILVPMMRRLLTRVRRTPALRALPVDHAVGFHRLVGNAMFAFALLHTGAYLRNYATDPKVTVAGQLLFTGAGLSGISLLVVLTVMWVFSRPRVRRRYRFESFSRTHLLYLGWLALALVHAPSFWKWAGVPLVGFAVEQALRRTRRAHRAEVLTADALRSGVTSLEISRPPGFRHRAGDYLFLCIPEIARHQWHPFTISSAPERDRLTVHVRTVGDWSMALRRLVDQRRPRRMNEPLLTRVDGPYRSAASDILGCRHAVLVGGGIGVAAFASVLESLALAACSGTARRRTLESVHLFWLNRDEDSFEWFADLLERLQDVDLGVDMHLVVTGGRAGVARAETSLPAPLGRAPAERPVVAEPRRRLRTSPPDWTRDLGDIAARYAPERVEVYFCGPPGLGHQIGQSCADLGLRFRPERF